MQSRKLFGAALASHEARLAGVKLPLRGAALMSQQKKLQQVPAKQTEKGVYVMIARDVGDDLMDATFDANVGVPWEDIGAFEADGNFAVRDEGRRQMLSVMSPRGRYIGRTSGVEAVSLVDFSDVDRRLDGEPTEKETSWKVLVGRFERRAARRARKEAAIERERQKLQQMIFSSSTEVAAAAATLAQKLARHEAAKRDYKSFMRRQMPQPKKLRGDPANIPAAKQWVEKNYPQRQAL